MLKPDEKNYETVHDVFEILTLVKHLPEIDFQPIVMHFICTIRFANPGI